MSAWEEKCWGRTRPTYLDSRFQRHELQTKTGGYCSVHFHERRANEFRVISGVIGVVTFMGWQWNRELLAEGDALAVPSRVPHRFEVFEGGTLVETYWPDRTGKIEVSDITRLTVGSCIADKGDMEPIEAMAKRFDAVIVSEIAAAVSQ